MRLIGSYSEKLAKKEAYNRNRGIARLRKAYKSGHITKQQVNKREYNKLLEISKGIEVSISEEKIAEDCKWDGLKGYITNSHLFRMRTPIPLCFKFAYFIVFVGHYIRKHEKAIGAR